MTSKTFRNPYPSAKSALHAWIVGDNGRGPHGLWGEPVRLGPDAFQVYGTRKRNGRHMNPVNVEFRTKTITVMLPMLPLKSSFGFRRKQGVRTITVVLTVKDEALAGAIWAAHANCSLLNGCLVTAISEGDAVSKVESLRERLEEAQEKTTAGLDSDLDEVSD